METPERTLNDWAEETGKVIRNEAYQAGYRAGQEAMREKVSRFLAGFLAGTEQRREWTDADAYRKVGALSAVEDIADAIRALPIDDAPQPEEKP